MPRRADPSAQWRPNDSRLTAPLCAIVLLRSSAGNAVLRDIRQTGRVARLRVQRRQDGAVLLEAEVLMVDDGSPVDLGRGELRWNLTVVG